MRALSITLLGALSLAAITSQAASHRKIVFIDQYDQDLDGKVSSIEFENSRRARFDLTDSNKDMIVDEEEYVYEWEDRLDAQLGFDRKEQVDQTATRFRSLDDNEDLVISWSEFEASGLWSFNRFDSNKDGVINERDVDAMGDSGTINMAERELSREQILHDEKRMLHMPSTHNKEGTITQYDMDGDDAVTMAEFTAGRKAFYDAMDENSDGDIVEDEYLAEFENRLDAELSRYRKNSVEQTFVRFNVLDENEDSKMTFQEYQNSGHRAFKRWDTDGDGYINYEEADPVETEFSREQADDENRNA